MGDLPMEDRLRRDLGDAATSIDPGDATSGLADAHWLARRRRRTRAALVTTFGAVVVVGAAVGVLVVTGDPATDRVSTADATSTSAAATTSAPGATTETPGAPATTGAPATSGVPATSSGPDADPIEQPTPATAPRVVPATAGAALEVPGFGADGATGSVGSFVDWLVPWKDGFLAGVTTSIQTSPEPLSEDLQSRFPQEVLDLFPDGLPPTLNEAQQILADAGLLDEVTEIVLNDQELYDALYAGPSELRLAVGSSPDGESWTPVELTLPAGMATAEQVVSTGDRLVVVGHESPDATTGDQPAGFEDVVVASTTDLVTWDATTVPSQLPDSLPAPLAKSYGASQIAVNERGWMLDVSDDVFADVELLLDELGIAPDGYGGHSSELVSDPPGVRVTLHTMDGNDVLAERVYTWDEIGLDVSLRAQVEEQLDAWQPTRWTATWGADPVEVPAGDGFEIAAIGSGFLQLGDPIRYSPDGRSWEAVAAAPPRQWATAVLPVEAGAVVLTQDRIGAGHAYLVDPTASTWEEITIDGAPPSLQPYDVRSRSTAIVVNGALPPDVDTTVVLEADGGRLTIANSRPERSYRLVDADGSVIAEESVDVLTTDDFEHLSYDDDGGLTVVDPASGEPLFTAGGEQVREAHEAAFGEPDPMAYPEEDLWLIATIDGERWVVHDLPDPDPSGQGWWPGPVAVNGDTVLLASSEQWLRFELPA